MSNRLILVGIMILAIGIIMLPGTLSLFSGQHDFYDISGDGNQVPCLKCHADVNTEMSGGNTNEAHRLVDCQGCHITSVTDKSIHAVSTVECVSCHNSLWKYHGTEFDITSGSCTTCHSGTGIAPNMDATNITNINEAHRKYAIAANQSTLMKGSNEACVSCHTHVAVNISWTRPTTLTMNVSNIDGTWNVTDFGTNGKITVHT